MQSFIVICAFFVVVGSYAYYSTREGSWFNILTPQVIVALPAVYIAQVLRLQYADDGYSAWLYLYLYLCSALPFLIYCVTLVKVRLPTALIVRHRPHVEIGYSPYVLISIGFLLYLPVIIEYRGFLLDPRYIYSQTRSGYGLQYFLSTAATFLGLMLFMFKKNRSWIESIVFFAACAALAFLHGSKTQLLILVFIGVLYLRYVGGKRVGVFAFLIGGSVLAVAMAALFYLFSVGIEIQDVGLLMVNYSDYTANGLLVMSDDQPALLGKIFFEDNVYSRIPRAIFPSKPADFGGFYLAKKYFPEAFYLDQGSPAFGVGMYFADFKWLTLPILCFSSFLLALLTKRYIHAAKKFKNPGDFVVLLFLGGVSLLPLGSGYLLPEHLVVSVLLGIFLRIKFLKRSNVVLL